MSEDVKMRHGTKIEGANKRRFRRYVAIAELRSRAEKRRIRRYVAIAELRSSRRERRVDKDPVLPT